MERVASFEEFRKNSSAIREDDEITLEAPMDAPAETSGKEEHYMFFRNLLTIKHNIEEILALDPQEIDAMIKDGHDWAEDHISTAKETIQQVADWVRGESELKNETPTAPAPEPIMDEPKDDEESDDAEKQEDDEEEKSEE